MLRQLLFVCLWFTGLCGLFAQDILVSGTITQNTTWTSNNTYLLRGFVYVKNGATLTIEPGTLIKGERSSKGALIVTKSGKIIADGTRQRPIIFTSNQPDGDRSYGDWGGVILLGEAPTNCIGNDCVVEGGVDNAAGDGRFGGNNPHHSSGILRYVRIEFAGIAFQPDNEINGLTMGGVGDSTIIEYIQVSYSGDDAFEWFGGTVNCKYLVAYNTWDDDLDTDFGYAGRVQFAFGLRDPGVADISQSNGIESDNSKAGLALPGAPYTTTIFSNVTLLGPKRTPTTQINGLFNAGAHIRRNSKQSVYNSVITGYPLTGYLLDGEDCESHALADELNFRDNVLAGNTNGFQLITYNGAPTLNITNWMNTHRDTVLTNLSDLQLVDPFNAQAPNPLPQAGSRLLYGANFTSPQLANDTVFEVVSFRGAFGTQNWMEGWTNWDPINNLRGTTGRTALQKLPFTLYPNPASEQATVQFASLKPGEQQLSLMDVQGRVVWQTRFTARESIVELQFPVSQLADGLYLVQVRNEGQQGSQRLLVQHLR